jgi:hypothetical protein
MERTLDHFLPEVKTLFFKDSPIIIHENLEGQRVENNILYLGLKAGPEIHITNLLHEMSHLVEIDDARILSYGWGLKYGSLVQVILGQEYQEFLSTAATEREIRVWAFQHQLQNLLGIDTPIKETVKSAVYLGDWANVAFGDKLNLKCQKKALEWVENQVVEKMKTLTLEFFQNEWTRKNCLLKSAQ